MLIGSATTITVGISHLFCIHPTDLSENTMSKQELRRDLDCGAPVAMVVGTVIGSGIFAVPKAMVLQRRLARQMVFAVWIFGGILSLFGALDVCRTGRGHARSRAANTRIFGLPMGRSSDFCTDGRRRGLRKADPSQRWRRYFSITLPPLRPASNESSFTIQPSDRPGRRAAGCAAGDNSAQWR